MKALLDPLHPLLSSILAILAQERELTAAEIHTKVRQYGVKPSLQNLYRTLGQMCDAQILVKNGKHMSLNFVWITHQLRFAETVRQTYFHAELLTDLPRGEGDRREFTADSLAGLDPVWNDLLVRMTAHPADGGLHEYASHPYYFLGKQETETSLYRALLGRGIPCLTLHGNDTFLDRYGNKIVAMEGVSSVNASDSGLPKEGYLLSIYDDWMVECTMPEVIAKHFAGFFRSVESIDVFDAELFTSIFSMRAQCKLTVRCSKKDAAHLKNKIAAHFPGRFRR